MSIRKASLFFTRALLGPGPQPPAQGRIATYVRNGYEGRYEGVGVSGGGGGQSR